MIDPAIIEIPDCPIFAKLEQRDDGFYVSLFSAESTCPAPPGKLRNAQTWEQAQAEAQRMLKGFHRILSNPIGRAVLCVAKRFGKQ